jgi:hypothetical protein
MIDHPRLQTFPRNASPRLRCPAAEPREEAAEAPSAEASADATNGRVRPRVLLLVLATQILLTTWVADSEIARGVYVVCYSLMMPTVLYLLAARGLARWLGLTRQEIVLGYIILTATLPLVSFGGLRFIMGGMGYLAHFSEVSPQWTRYLGHLPSLPVLHDPQAIAAFYRGHGAAVPWGAWAVPIAFWSTYLLLLVGIWLGLAAVLHRVWIQHERLSFPITVLPLQITDPKDDLFRKPGFWLGAAVPVILQSLLALHEWYPGVPAITLKAIDFKPILFTSPPWDAMPNFNLSFYPMAVGLAYFVPSDVSFSCWFFWLAARLMAVAGASAGLGGGGGAGVAARFPLAEEQASGAWIAFGLLALWGARRHFGSTVRDLAAADRQALKRWGGGAAACAVACVLMMAVVGVPILVAVVVLTVYIAFIVSAARIRAEAGGMWTMASVIMTPHRTALAALGTLTLPEKGLVAGGHFDLIHVEVRGQSLPYLMEGLKMADTLGIRWRTVLFWVGIGSITALAIGWWSGLSQFYDLGAATAKTDPYIVAKARTLMSGMNNAASNRAAWDAPGIGAMVAAGAFTLFLAWMRTIFPAFPLHPVGYVACNTHTMTAFFVPFFFSWMVKGLLLRYGGTAAFRKGTPFFVGLIVGDIVIQAFWATAGRLFDAPVYSFLT